MIDRETLAKAIHESAREAVEKGATVAADKFGEPARKFTEWDDLSELARDGKRTQADFLLNHFAVWPDTAIVRPLKGVLAELCRAQRKHPGRIVLRHQAWGIIDEEWTKCKNAMARNDYREAGKRLDSTAAMCVMTSMDWLLIQKIESDLTVLNDLDPTKTGQTD